MKVLVHSLTDRRRRARQVGEAVGAVVGGGGYGDWFVDRQCSCQPIGAGVTRFLLSAWARPQPSGSAELRQERAREGLFLKEFSS